MQFSVTFRHMEATAALKEYAEERMQRIKKYFPDPMKVHVTMSTHRYNHTVDVNVQLHNGFTLGGQETTEDMYSSIDLVVAKLLRQVRKYKDKLRTHKARNVPAFDPIPYSHKVIAEQEPVPEAKPVAPPEPPVVVETEKFHASPMSVSEAIMQLNLAHEAFLVFACQGTGAVNVVYRRDDGTYGLIETPASPS
jgi:putative sigma-54 modulation protein